MLEVEELFVMNFQLK